MKNIKNLMSNELIEWTRGKHGRLAQIARACGVSHRQARAWRNHESGIAQLHHKKIFDLTGINPALQ